MRKQTVGQLLALTRESDDWTPWMVLADALSEWGDRRGALIRALHELAEGDAEDPDRVDVSDRKALAEWCVAEERRDQSRWEAFLPNPVPQGLNFGWDRGFLRQLYVRRIGEDVIAYLTELLRHPYGQAINHLRLQYRNSTPTVAQLEQLLSSPFASPIPHWSFSRQGLVAEHGRVIARALRGLRSLDLSANSLGDEGIQAICHAPWDTLQGLYVAGNRLGSVGLQSIAQAEWPDLMALHLRGVWFDEPAARAFGDAIYVERLSMVWLVACQLGASGTAALLRRPWPNLRGLSLTANELGDSGVMCLTPERLPSLERVWLMHNRIGPMGAKVFASHGWPQLRTAEFTGNPLETEGREALESQAYEVAVTQP